MPPKPQLPERAVYPLLWNVDTLAYEAEQVTAGGGFGSDVNVTNTQLHVVVDSLPASGGGLTDTELRATAVPVSLASAPLPALAATSTKQDTGNTSIASVDGKTPALGQALAAASVPVVLTAAQVATLTPPAAITGFATESTLGTRLSETDFDTKTGSLTETAPATDTASSGVNGRLQRVAQRLSSLIGLLPTSLGAGGGLKVDGSGTALPVSIAATVTVSGALTDTQLRATAVPVSHTQLPVALAAGGGLKVEGVVGGVAQPVSVAALPLPSNAAIEAGGNLATIAGKDFATSAKQDTGNTSLATIATNTTNAATSTLQTTGNASLATLAAAVKTEDAASADGETGLPMLAVRQDIPSGSTSTTGDYGMLKADSEGRLWVGSDVLADLAKRQNDLLLAHARLAADSLRFHSMMTGAFVPVQEVW